jgi:hypothetical protein
VYPVDQRSAQCRPFNDEAVDGVLDEVGGARVVLGQVDEPFGD